MVNIPRRLLAADVVIVADSAATGGFLARKPGQETSVQLTKAEVFLAEGMRQPYSEVVLLAQCNARFGGTLTTADLRRLLDKLDQAGFLAPLSPSVSAREPVAGGAAAEPGAESRPVERSPAESPEREDTDRTTYRNHWPWGNPQALLDRLLSVCSFLRHFRVLVPLAFVTASFGLVKNLDWFAQDIGGIRSEINLFGRVIFSLVTISLITQVFRGLVARHFGFATPSFGMKLVFGLIPRFDLRITIPEEAPRQARLWAFGAPIYVRFLVFPLGIVLWLAGRDQATSLPLIGAGLAMVAVISALFVANPLLGGPGYRFLSEYYEVPNLRQRAFARLKNLFSSRPAVVQQYLDRSPAVLAYGVLSILFTVMVIGILGFIAARWLEVHYQGLGVAVFLLIVFYLLWRFAYPGLRSRWQQRRAQASVTHLQRDRAKNQEQPRSWWSTYKFRRRDLVLLVFLGVLFLPYEYETGGAVEVFPIAHARIYADAPAVLERVHVLGGETLEKGAVVAELVSDRQQYDVARTEAEILGKQEALNVLLTTPLPEQVRVAQEELKKREVQLRYSKQHLRRVEELYQNRSVSLAEYQDALQQVDLARQELEVDRAQLDSIKNQVNEHQVEVLRVELAVLQRKLVYHRQVLERTRLRMPIDGMITTMNLMEWQHGFLDAGEVFAEVEDLSRVRVEIRIPEGDIGEVEPGAAVRLRLRAYSNRDFHCELDRVFPVTMADSMGRYLIGDCVVANDNGELKSGMTGFAKIEGRRMLVINAFSRAIVRFVKVEVWSWLP